jgi:hypothetical protein
MIACPCSCGDESGKPDSKSLAGSASIEPPEGPSLFGRAASRSAAPRADRTLGIKSFCCAPRAAVRTNALTCGLCSDDWSSQSSLRLANSQRPGRIVSSQSRDSDETFHDMAPFLLRMIVRYSVELLNAVKRRITLVFVLFSNWSPHTYAFEFIWQITILCGAH